MKLIAKMGPYYGAMVKRAFKDEMTLQEAQTADASDGVPPSAR
jgi:hypothetical protein